ncbi:MAG: hypothetical protein FWG58_05235 [Methanomassiliicoccaceae archaeon]|nr:hypothetical protein [Methanomassiliicoccaceae archaeon]
MEGDIPDPWIRDANTAEPPDDMTRYNAGPAEEGRRMSATESTAKVQTFTRTAMNTPDRMTATKKEGGPDMEKPLGSADAVKKFAEGHGIKDQGPEGGPPG